MSIAAELFARIGRRPTDWFVIPSGWACGWRGIPLLPSSESLGARVAPSDGDSSPPSPARSEWQPVLFGERVELVIGQFDRGSPDVLLEMVDASGPRNRQHDLGAFEQPGKRDLGSRGVVARGDDAQRSALSGQLARLQR